MKYSSESSCVCLSVCLSANNTRDIYQIFGALVHIAYGRGSVFLWQAEEIQRGNFRFILPH